MIRLKYGNTNTFLVEGSSGYLLIDTDYDTPLTVTHEIGILQNAGGGAELLHPAGIFECSHSIRIVSNVYSPLETR